MSKCSLQFNVIVTCTATPKTLFALINKSSITGYRDEDIGGFQVMCDLTVNYEEFDEYFDIMRRLEMKILRYMRKNFNLSSRDIIKVSTAANWESWEKKTKKNYIDSMYSCIGYENGKFIKQGFHEQEKLLTQLGINISMLAYMSYQAFNNMRGK